MQSNASLKNRILINIIVAAIYFSLTALMQAGSDGIQTSYTSNQLSICPVISVETAAVILIGPFIWPGITIAAFAGAIIKGFTITSALLSALAHGFGALGSGLVVHRWIKNKNPFLKVRDFLHYLIIVALLISSGISAIRALSISLNLENLQSYPTLFITLWINAINSMLVVTPFIVAWGTKAISKPGKPLFHSSIFAFILTLMVIIWAVSGGQGFNPGQISLRSEFIIIPIVILATTLFGLRGAVSASLVYSIIFIAFPAFGLPLFSSSNSSNNTLFLQSYQSIVAATGLLAAASLSERDKALQDVNEAHITQQAFLNNAGIWLSTIDGDNNIITWSKGAEKISGYTYQEISGDQLFWNHIFLPQEENAPDNRNFLESIKDGVFLKDFEMPIRTRSDEKRLISWNINTLKSNAGKDLGRMIAGTDITAQRQAENHLRQERDLAEALVNAAMMVSGTLEREEIIHRILSQALTVIPCDGVNLLLLQENNLQVVYQYGYQNLVTPESVTNTHFSPDETRIILENAESDERTLIADTWQDPRWFSTPTTGWIRSYISVPIRVRGKILGLVNLDSSKPNNFNYAHVRTLKTLCALLSNTFENVQRYDDIQLQADELEKRVKERTAELSSANQELQRALRLKDEFLANMSHELRTPLTAILGMSELLESQARGPLNETQIRYTQTIMDSGQHLLSLINDILDLAKIEAEKLEISIDSVYVNEVCDSCLFMIRPIAHSKNILLDFVPLQPDLAIQADPLRLKQILINLLNNAVKFTDEGGTIGLEIHQVPSSQNVQFLVWDTGIGISPEDAKQLFKPFAQVDGSLSRSFDGAGLGLSLVAKLVELHGGSVKLESEGICGKGTRLTVTLPLHQDNSLTAPLPVFPAAAEVLLIEDNNSSIQQIYRAISAADITMRVAKCTEEAADLDRSGYPDLVIINLQTCKTDGWRIIKKLYSWFSPCTPPIIVITSISLPGDEELAAASGASAYLTKPVDMNQLSNLVSSLIEKRETHE